MSMHESGQSSPRRIMIMAGGTGGHVFPALAVADALRSQGHVVHWLGTGRGIENDVVPAAGLPLSRLSVQGVRGKGPLDKLLAPVRLVHALGQALRLLQGFKPDVVLGMGGFAAGPGGIAAWLLRRPLVIHEQNAVAGTTNRWLARVASARLTAFEGVLPERYQPECVGNPLRQAIAQVPPPARRGVGDRQPLRLLVLGGSQGALSINQLMPQAIARLPENGRPAVRHQCGRVHEKITREAYAGCGVMAEVQPFIEDMAEALAWADLVVARAGALTVSELAAVGVGSVLIPFPFAIDDHQTRNADRLVKVHAARVLAQSELNEETLAAVIRQSLRPDRLKAAAEAARQAGQPRATERVVAIINELAEGRA